MDSDAIVLIIDAVVGPPNEDPLTKFLDLMMLVSAGGRERTEDEWRSLLSTAGLSLRDTTRITATTSLLVAASLV